MNSNSPDLQFPLAVDLDGTLLQTDLLYERLFLTIKKNIFYVVSCILWLLKGRVVLKNKLLQTAELRTDVLPHNTEVLNFITEEFNKGRKIILVTASSQADADEVAKNYPLFTEVYGSSATVNLKGAAKAALLTEKFGAGKFDYMGNERADLKVFQQCRFAYLVNASNSLQAKTKQVATIKGVYKNAKISFYEYAKTIRIHQWVKNLLLFVPLITSHSFDSIFQFFSLLVAFVSFSLMASSGYLINDMLDLNADRIHPQKKNRLLASGRLGIPDALLLIIAFFTVAVILAIAISIKFLIILMAYFIISLLYSLVFKKITLCDVFTLAMLYSIRVFAGGVVMGIALSFWLIAFSAFIFLSLAFVKRYSELMLVNNETDLITRGRGYISTDLGSLQIMGIASGFMAAIVFALYINSAEVIKLYKTPLLLWPISFLILFWINSIWLVTARGKMHVDPVVYAIKDPISYLMFFIAGVLLFAAAAYPF